MNVFKALNSLTAECTTEREKELVQESIRITTYFLNHLLSLADRPTKLKSIKNTKEQ